jgi:NitT/TauT family transport system substrate-binding protein
MIKRAIHAAAIAGLTVLGIAGAQAEPLAIHIGWSTAPSHIQPLIDFFEDHLRAVRWFLDPAHHAEAIDIAQAVTKQPAENLDYVFTKEDIYRSPDGMPNMAAVQHEIDKMVALNVVPEKIAAEPGYTDLSLIKQAKARLDGK